MALYPGMHRRSQPLGHREHQVEELGRRATREANHLHDDVVCTMYVTTTMTVAFFKAVLDRTMIMASL